MVSRVVPGGGEPDAMVCEDCGKTWFSTAFLQEGDHTCPDCEGSLTHPSAGDVGG